MVNCNPVIPVMDWTEDAELHKRYVEWKEEVELELESSLDGQGSQLETILRVYHNQSSNMREQVQRPYYKP